MLNAAVLVMGFSSSLLQILFLRKLLSFYSGNELVIGLVLAVWLLATAAGSFLGRRYSGPNMLAFTFIAAGVCAQLSLLFIEQSARIFSTIPGEAVSLFTTLLSASAALFPLGIALGLQFPLCAAALNGNSSRVYGLEAAAACLGGIVFTFLLAGRVPGFPLASVLAGLNILVGVLLLKRKVFGLLLLTPVVLFLAHDHPGLDERMGETVLRKESRYGEIAVYRDRDQVNVYAGGSFRFSYPDRETEELKAHVPLSLHPSPGSVLVIGGSPALMREVLVSGAERAVFVEIDPDLTRTSLGLLSSEDRDILHDRRLEIVSRDARSYLNSRTDAEFDLVLLNLPEPSTADLNRFYTSGFFRKVKAGLREQGILCLTLPPSSGYIGRRLQFAGGSVYATLRSVFAYVEVSSEEYGGMYASDRPIETRPAVLLERFSARRVPVRNFYPQRFSDIFDASKTAAVRSRLGRVSIVNTDERPMAYLFNLMLWADVHGAGVLNLALGAGRTGMLVTGGTALILIIAMRRKRERAVPYAVFTAGWASISLSLVALLAFQAEFGRLYGSIGMLTALFMAGLAGGSLLTGRLSPGPGNLAMLETGFMLLIAAAPLFFTHEYLYSVLCMLCGIIAGAEFSAAVRCCRTSGGSPAGTLYAADVAGSAAGALLTTILLVPLLGIKGTLLVLFVLKGSSLALLALFLRGQKPYGTQIKADDADKVNPMTL